MILFGGALSVAQSFASQPRPAAVALGMVAILTGTALVLLGSYPVSNGRIDVRGVHLRFSSSPVEDAHEEPSEASEPPEIASEANDDGRARNSNHAVPERPGDEPPVDARSAS